MTKRTAQATTTQPEQIAPASRILSPAATCIPLPKVQSALHHCSAAAAARAALRAALALVPMDNLNLRSAIREAVAVAECDRVLVSILVRCATEVSHG